MLDWIFNGLWYTRLYRANIRFDYFEWRRVILSMVYIELIKGYVMGIFLKQNRGKFRLILAKPIKENIVFEL